MPRPRKPRVDLAAVDAAALAQHFGVARASVAAIVARHGAPLRAGRPALPPEAVARVLNLYRDDSLRVAEIAELVGRSPSTIYRLIKQASRAIERRGTGN